MANLIEYIQSQVYENSTEDISGSIMQQVLTRMASDEGVVNVHTISGQTPFADYNNAQAARDAVPAGFKKLGLIITYKLSSGWYIDEFIGSATSGWSTASNWKCLGPISVSQNASTGKTTITIGSESFDVATQPVSVSQNIETGHTDINIGSNSYPVVSVEELGGLKGFVISSHPTSKSIVELYLYGNGIDTSHQYVIDRIDRNDNNYWRFYVKDITSDAYVIVFDSYSIEPNGIIVLQPYNGSGISGYVIIDWDAITTAQNKNLNMVLTDKAFFFDFSPCIKFTIGESILNINHLLSQNTAFINAQTARDSVPQIIRKLGLKITFLMSDGWHTEHYKGTTIADWSKTQSWETENVLLQKNVQSVRTISDGVVADSVSSLYAVKDISSGLSFVRGFAGLNGVFLGIGGTTSYGFKYIQVKKNQLYKLSGEYNIASNAFPTLLFTTNVAATNSQGNVLETPASTSYKLDKELVFDSDGYLYIWVGSVVDVVKIEEMSVLPQHSEKVELSINGLVMPDGTEPEATGTQYYKTPHLPINNFHRIVANLHGNDIVGNVVFFDENDDAIPALSLKAPGYYLWDINLSSPLYQNARYFVLCTSQFSDYPDIYATIYPNEGVDNIDKRAYRICDYKKINCIGDSLTNASHWDELVCGYLNIPQHTRGGASGSTMATVAANSIYESIQAMTADDSDLILLWAGTNDFGWNVNIGDWDEQLNPQTRNTNTFYGAMIGSAEKLTTLFPGKRIVFIGTTPRVWNGGAKNSSDDKYGGGDFYLWQYVDAVKKVAEYFGFPFLDLFRTAGINKLNIGEYMFKQYPQSSQSEEDAYWLHFSEDGRKLIAKRIASFIQSIG